MFRYYQPYLNQFIQADTILPDYRNPQTINKYSYALNNPVRYTDPSGHYFTELEEGGIGWLDTNPQNPPTPTPTPETEEDNGNGAHPVSKNPVGYCGSLSDCFLSNYSLFFLPDQEISTEEFDEFLLVLFTHIDSVKRGTFDAGRSSYDTPFYDGNPINGEQKYEGVDVCIMGECYDQTAVNYVAQGMYSAAANEPRWLVPIIARVWNGLAYWHGASDEEIYWMRYGYDYYQQKKELEENDDNE